MYTVVHKRRFLENFPCQNVEHFIHRIKMTTATTKMTPVPVRLNRAEQVSVGEIARTTGLSKSEILRRACRFAFPKFLSGEVDISRVVATAEPNT